MATDLTNIIPVSQDGNVRVYEYVDTINLRAAVRERLNTYKDRTEYEVTVEPVDIATGDLPTLTINGIVYQLRSFLMTIDEQGRVTGYPYTDIRRVAEPSSPPTEKAQSIIYEVMRQIAADITRDHVRSEQLRLAARQASIKSLVESKQRELQQKVTEYNEEVSKLLDEIREYGNLLDVPFVVPTWEASLGVQVRR